MSQRSPSNTNWYDKGIWYVGNQFELRFYVPTERLEILLQSPYPQSLADCRKKFPILGNREAGDEGYSRIDLEP